MSEILVAVTEEGKSYVTSSQSFRDVSGLLSSNNNEKVAIEGILAQARSIIDNKLQQQINVERAMAAEGINLKEVFNQNSITGKAYYDEKYVENFSKNYFKNEKNLKANKNKWSQQQDKIYQETAKYYKEISKKIQDLNFQNMSLEQIESTLKKAIQEVNGLDAFVHTKEKELQTLRKTAQDNILSNLSDLHFLNDLQNIYGQDIQVPEISIQRQGSSSIKVNSPKAQQKEFEELQKTISIRIRNVLSGLIGEESISSQEDLSTIIQRIKNTSYEKSNRLGKTFNSQMKGELKEVKEKLYNYLLAINSENKKINKKTEEAIEKIARKKINELLDNIQFRDGKIFFPKITLTDESNISTSNAKSSLGLVTEVSFKEGPDTLDFSTFLEDMGAKTLFSGQKFFRRYQYEINGKIEQAYVEEDYDLGLTFSPFDTSNNELLKRNENKSVQGKIDNIEKVMNKDNTKGFIIVYSDKFLDAYSGMSGVHLLGSFENNASLMSSLDLFVSNPNNTLMQKLYSAAITLSNASVYNSENGRNNLNSIADQILSAHFLDIAFDASSFENQLQKSLEETGMSQVYGQQDNVLYVMRVTNTYHPASHVLMSLKKSFEPTSMSIMENIIKSEIKYDESLSGMEEGSLWEAARKKHPDNRHRDARWGYLAAQVAENTKIKATLNVAKMNAFMRLGI